MKFIGLKNAMRIEMMSEIFISARSCTRTCTPVGVLGWLGGWVGDGGREGGREAQAARWTNTFRFFFWSTTRWLVCKPNKTRCDAGKLKTPHGREQPQTQSGQGETAAMGTTGARKQKATSERSEWRACSCSCELSAMASDRSESSSKCGRSSGGMNPFASVLKLRLLIVASTS